MWGPSAKIRPLLSQVWGHSLVNEIRFIHLPPSQVLIKRISCVLIAALALVISACSISLAEDIAPPPGAQQQPVPSGESLPVSGPHYPLVPPNPENGASIYADKCAACHGDTGQGDGPQAAQLPNPATPIGTRAVARQASPQDWYAIVTNGNLDRLMPPFGSLSDTERWDVVAYVYTLSTSDIELALGKDIFLENCAECHGENGNGKGPQAAGLTTPLPDFTAQTFMAQFSTADFYQAVSEVPSGEMHAFADLLDDQQRWAVSSYIRSMGFSGSSSEILAEPSEPAQPSTEEPLAGTVSAMGRVTGKIINGSGGELPADLVITLHGFDGMQIVYNETTTAQDDGAYFFEGVELAPERRFLVSAEYGQATYISELASVNEGISNIALDVTVFDTTSDISSLTVERLHIFFEFTEEEMIQVVQLFIFSNEGDKTIVPFQEGGPVVDFALPEGAMNLQFQDGVLGERYIKTPTGFADTVAVRPGTGEYQVLFAFDMPYKRKLDIVQPLNHKVEAAVIMLPEDGVKIRSDILSDDGPRPVEGRTIHLYSANNLEAGSMLEMTLSSGIGPGFSLTSDSSTSLVIGLGSFGLVMIVAGVWLFIRNQGKAREMEDELEDEPEQYAEEDVESLMDAIIALDDLYSEGKLPEEAYRKRRAELKERLKEISG
jgi:mono/diheme cytochrome c family protein